VERLVNSIFKVLKMSQNDWHVTFFSGDAKLTRAGEFLWSLPSHFVFKSTDYEMGIVSLSLPSRHLRKPTLQTYLIISCDVVHEEVVGLRNLGLLLACNVDTVAHSTSETHQTIKIQHVQYTPIIAANLKNITLKFYYRDDTPLEFSNPGEIMLQLHIRRTPLSFV
jgi:hypothetical protein